MFSKKIVPLSAVLAGCLSPSPTLAQTAAPADAASAPGLEEIVVTAQKRSENLQKVPITITAVTSAQAAAAGVRTTQDLQIIVPGFTVQRQSAAADVFLRGIGTTGGQAGQENAVAIFVDGVYQPSMNQALFSLNNIMRVEVLKGPQGTLYGRNATGGAVNIITRDPSSTPAVQGEVGYGNYNTIDGSLYATTGLGTKAAVDIAAYYHDQMDGFGTNVTTGHDVNRSKELALRSKLLLNATDTTKIIVAGTYAHSTGSFGLAYRPAPSAITVTGQRGFPYGFYDVQGDLDPDSRQTQWSVSGKIDQNLGWAQLVSISAYQHARTSFAVDLDQTALPLINVFNGQITRTFTQELQLGSGQNRGFTWVVGAYYFNDLSAYDPFRLNGAGLAPATDLIYSPDRQKTNSYAIYGQTTFEIVDRTKLTLGGRYTIDRRSLFAVGTLVIPGVGNLPAFPTVDTAKTFRKATWRIALDHEFGADVLGYVSYNRGFKSGIYNLTAPTDPVVNPETLDAYEAGLKSSLLDRRLRVNASIFLYNYRNIQLSKVNGNGATLLNAAKARLYGLDLDADANPVENLTLHAGLEYVHSRYTRFPGAPFTMPSPAGGDITVAGDASGNHLLRSPAIIFSASANYEAPLAGGSKLGLNISYNHTGSFFWEPDNRLRQEAVNLVNSQVKWTSPNGRYSLRIWGRNLLREKYFDQVGGTSFGDLVTISPGRTFGASAGFSF